MWWGLMDSFGGAAIKAAVGVMFTASSLTIFSYTLPCAGILTASACAQLRPKRLFTASDSIKAYIKAWQRAECRCPDG